MSPTTDVADELVRAGTAIIVGPSAGSYVSAVSHPVTGDVRLYSGASELNLAEYFNGTAQSGTPVIIPNSGTVATNGVLTIGSSAMPTTYNTPGAWVYLPADAVVGGAAGFYWSVWSSATQGQIYTEYVAEGAATQFTPYVPTGTLTAAVGSNSAYTQTTGTPIRLVNVNMPANTMGPNGVLDIQGHFTGPTGAAGARTVGWGLGANFAATGSVLQTTYATGLLWQQLRNRGAANRQVGRHPATPQNGGSTSASVYFTEDTTTDRNVFLTAQLANATDIIVLESFAFGVIPKN
jgi:hypothetical protein